jgi:uncharacterized protein YjiS (DUF1127 family)
MSTMAMVTSDLQTTHGARPHGRLGPVLADMAARLVVWDARYRERRRIAALPDETLRDAGLSRAQAESEAAKAVWRA